MEYISHRVNTINELINTPKEFGIEVDLRDYHDRLILQHDPFSDGEDFEEYLKNDNHGTMILNIKSERIEFRALELIEQYNVKNYFFLDSSFPMIHTLLAQKENKVAIRFSEFEAIDTILNLKNKVKWVWVDCFTKLPINPSIYKLLKDSNFSLCLVSPELQGQENKISDYKKYLEDNDIVFDAICTKYHNIEKWK